MKKNIQKTTLGKHDHQPAAAQLRSVDHWQKLQLQVIHLVSFLDLAAKCRAQCRAQCCAQCRDGGIESHAGQNRNLEQDPENLYNDDQSLDSSLTRGSISKKCLTYHRSHPSDDLGLWSCHELSSTLLHSLAATQPRLCFEVFGVTSPQNEQWHRRLASQRHC